MIRIEGSVKEAQKVENLIKNGTLYLSIPFKVRRHDGGQDGEGFENGIQCNSFTRDYEVFGAAEDIKRVHGSSDVAWAKTILWLIRKEIRITFWYDLRVDKCHISVSCDSWQRLLKLLPQLHDMVRIIEPNRCEIVAVA